MYTNPYVLCIHGIHPEPGICPVARRKTHMAGVRVVRTNRVHADLVRFYEAACVLISDWLYANKFVHPNKMFNHNFINAFKCKQDAT